MKFWNPHQKKVCRGFTHFLLWQLGYYNDPTLPPSIPEGFVFPNYEDHLDPSKPLVTWINHSTFRIEAEGVQFLVDPIFSERCSPVHFFGPKRYHAPSPSIDQLNGVDYVIISHNHYDHLDKKSLIKLHRLYPKIIWIIPQGMKKWFIRQFRKSEIIELKWWETVVCDKFTLTAVPAQHFSGRGLFDQNRSHWMGCVVKYHDGKQFYFAGDTGYNQYDFKEIGRRFGAMDLSLIPIGTYRPRLFMRSVHVNPEESILIHREVNSRFSLGGHWGTFCLSSEEMTRPPYDLFCALEKAQISPSEFRVVIPGQSLNWGS